MVTSMLTGRGGIYMSDDEQDLIVGRVTRELKEAERQLALNHSVAKQMGERFSHLGKLLSSHPEEIQFENRGCDTIFQRREMNEKILTLKPLDMEYSAVVELVEKIRTIIAIVTRLQAEKQSHGY